MNAVLTKLSQELLTVIEQTRDAQASAEKIVSHIRQEGVPDIDAPDPTDLDEVYRGYDIQSQIQQLKVTHQDAFELINEIIGFVLFIKQRVQAIVESEQEQRDEILQEYEHQMAGLQRRCAEIQARKHALVRGLQQRAEVLGRLISIQE